MASFSVGKFGLRSLSQTLARELSGKGIHVAHVVIDGPVDVPLVRKKIQQSLSQRPTSLLFLFLISSEQMEQFERRLSKPEDIAEVYWMLHAQPSSSWSQEIDVRSYAEPMAKM